MEIETINSNQIVIRKAEKEDLHLIYELVKELAEFELEPDAVVTKIFDYENAFNEGLLQASLAFSSNQLAGMTVYYMTFSTWKGKCLYLEDFYVLQQFRRSGVGQLLFNDFLSRAKAQKATMVKWQVLDWNNTGLSFYEKNQAIIEKNWWNGKIYFE